MSVNLAYVMALISSIAVSVSTVFSYNVHLWQERTEAHFSDVQKRMDIAESHADALDRQMLITESSVKQLLHQAKALELQLRRTSP